MQVTFGPPVVTTRRTGARRTSVAKMLCEERMHALWFRDLMFPSIAKLRFFFSLREAGASGTSLYPHAGTSLPTFRTVDRGPFPPIRKVILLGITGEQNPVLLEPQSEHSINICCMHE